MARLRFLAFCGNCRYCRSRRATVYTARVEAGCCLSITGDDQPPDHRWRRDDAIRAPKTVLLAGLPSPRAAGRSAMRGAPGTRLEPAESAPARAHRPRPLDVVPAPGCGASAGRLPLPVLRCTGNGGRPLRPTHTGWDRRTGKSAGAVPSVPRAEDGAREGAGGRGVTISRTLALGSARGVANPCPQVFEWGS